MKVSSRVAASAFVLTLGVGGLVGYFVARARPAPAMSAGGGSPPAEGRSPLYWYDPMVPNQHFDKPGKSPFMDMQLVPRYAGADDGTDASVKISADVTQNLGVRLTTVERGPLARTAEAPGVVQYDPRHSSVVQARAEGIVQSIHRRAEGDVVEAGAALVDLLVPSWVASQAEFVALVRSGDAGLIAAARQRLFIQGMPSSVIARLEGTLDPSATITLTSPSSGALEEFAVRPGMTIEPGATVARVADLNPLWIEASLPTSEATSVTSGDRVEVVLGSFGDAPLRGEVIAILPDASSETRALRVRISVKNPDRVLRPGMYVQVRFGTSRRNASLLVASEAIIRSGTRNLVILAREGRFLPVEVSLGAEAAGRTEVLKGLSEGQQVVASGQFLIDSEANLRGLLERMKMGSPAAASGASDLHEGTGKVVSVSGDRVTIAHGPVASMQWPAMTMAFHLKDAREVKPGDVLHFWFHPSGDDFEIERIERAEPQP